MINFNTVDFSERRSEEVMFLLTLSVVQITNPIRKRIAIRNGFRNVIRSFVNRPKVKLEVICHADKLGDMLAQNELCIRPCMQITAQGSICVPTPTFWS